MTEKGTGTVIELKEYDYEGESISQVILKVNNRYTVCFSRDLFPETVNVGDNFCYTIKPNLVTVEPC